MNTCPGPGAGRVIYLDHHATTPVDPRVLDAMLPYLTAAYGNASSPHAYGRTADSAVGTARQQLRELIGASTDTEIVFTSGATEADHLAITGMARALGGAGSHVITTAIEHKAVLAACQHLVSQGFQVTVIPVSGDGLVDPGDVEAAITPATVLVSVMHASNEIGTIQPLADIARITRERGVPLHTDAAQSLGSLPFNVDDLGIDLASFSGHKIYGPKGIGALYVRRGTVRPVPEVDGGGQEFGLRPGTLNVPGIAGLGEAAAILVGERDSDAYRIAVLRDLLLALLRETIPGIRVNGTLTSRLPGNLNITIPGIEADDLIARLPGLAISTGSACSTGQPEPSHVLTAIGLNRPSARATIRIGLGRKTNTEDIADAASQISVAARQSAAIP
ncbi:MAG: cysteine desulfurase family protein [Trebonia sp.]